MKTHISLIMMLLAISLAATAQEQRFIETVVSDTVKLKPLIFKYEVTLGGDQMYAYDYAPQQSLVDTSNTTTMADVEAFLKNEKFTWTPGSNNSYTIIKGSAGKSSVVITLRSVAELDRLCKGLNNLKGISGKIISTEYEPAALYNDAIFKKLYDKAFAEATIIAKTTGNQVGRMLSVTEPTDIYSGYMDWLSELSKISPADIWGLNSDLYKVYTRKMAFRFELK